MSMEEKQNFQTFQDFSGSILKPTKEKEISEIIKEVILTDGFKFRLGKMHWLMFRFSGTEPLLRIMIESVNKASLNYWISELSEIAYKEFH